MEGLEITEDDVRAFCLQQLPQDSAKFIALRAEFLSDPVNSRIGRYSRDGERVMRIVESAEVNWEATIAAVEAEELT